MSPVGSRGATLRTAVLLAGWMLLWSVGPLFGRETWFFHDLRHHHYPWRAWVARTWASGELPAWAPVAHGYPLHADGQAGVLYPPDLLLYLLLPEHLAFSWSIILHHLLAAVGGLFLARVLGRSLSASMVAGVAFGTSGLLVSHLVYLPMFQVIAWTPWAVALALLAVERGGTRWVVAGSVLGLTWLCGHPQMALYATYAVVFVAGWRAVELRKARGWRPASRLLLLGLLAAVVASPQLVPTLELAALGGRAGGVDPAFAAMGSLPPEELLNGVLPDLLGHESPALVATTYHHRAGAYAGRGVSYLEGVFYLGIPAVLLALAAGRTRRGRAWWVLAGLGLLVMLGPATPAFHLYRLLPGVEGLRFPVRASLWVTLAVSQLAALGTDRLGAWLYARREWVARRVAVVVVAALAGLALAGASHLALGQLRPELDRALAARLVRPATPEGLPARGPEEALERAGQVLDQLQRSTDPLDRRVFWPVGLVLCFAVPWWLAARSRVPETMPVRLAWVFLAIDLTVFGYDFNPTTPVEQVTERPDSAVPVLGVPGTWRATTLDRRQPQELDRALLSANLGLLWGLEDVIVPSPLRTSRNQAYLERVGLDLGLADGEEQVRRFAANRHLADLSGIRFLFTTHDLDLPDMEPAWEGEVHDHKVRVYENRRWLPRGFAVGCTRPVSSAAEALDAVVALDDPAAVAVVEGEGLDRCVPGPAGSVEVERLSSSTLRFRADLERDGWLVITESAYPGQLLTVDGEPARAVRTDHLFQGVALPPGEHEVVLESTSMRLLALVLGVQVVWMAALAWAWVGRRRLG